MKIYTKTGDKGETSLFGGKRVSKADTQVEAYGAVDELTSYLGLLIAYLPDEKKQVLLTAIQKNLYEMMAVLSGAKQPIEHIAARINELEQTIDQIEAELPELRRFILPQGNKETATAHIARTICRRAERSVVRLQTEEKIDEEKIKIIIQYLNRLSDFLFVFARLLSRGREVVT